MKGFFIRYFLPLESSVGLSVYVVVGVVLQLQNSRRVFDGRSTGLLQL